MKICFDTDVELPEIREALEHSSMTLKLKGDTEVRHQMGLQKAFDAFTRCDLILDALRSTPGSGHLIEQFQSLQIEARNQIQRYHKEFKLTVVTESATSAPHVVAQPVTRPTPPQQAAGISRSMQAEQLSPVIRPKAAGRAGVKMTEERVAQCKKLLHDCGTTITYSDVEKVAQFFPECSAANILQIAKGVTWLHVPWPYDKQPKYVPSRD